MTYFIYLQLTICWLIKYVTVIYGDANKQVLTLNFNHWTMKYRSQWPTIIFRLNIGSYWLIIQKYGVYISNRLQDIRQNHWTIKYRSQRPTFILRSNVKSYWLVILKHDVHTSNSLQDIRQNHWTMKYRSQWPTFILRSNVVSYWLIIPKYGLHISNEPRQANLCLRAFRHDKILTAHAQPFRGARDLAFCLKVPLDSLLVWASSGGSGETARMRRLAWTFAARIGDKYQIRLTRSK